MIRVGKKSFSWNSFRFRLGGIASQRVSSIDFDEKVTDELIYGNRRDGTPQGVTAGKYEPGMVTMKFQIGEWYGEPGKGNVGLLTPLTLGKSVGLSDVECDSDLQWFEDGVGSCGVNFPLLRPVSMKDSHSIGTSGSEVEIGFRCIAPIKRNGTQLASIIRSITL